MANKQTLVANAKQAIEHLSRNKPTIVRLQKEMLEDTDQVIKKIIDLNKDISRTLCLNVQNGLPAYAERHLEVLAQFQALLESHKQLREEFLGVFQIARGAVTAMGRFIDIYKSDSWATLTRSDILELRKIFKKDLRIAKLKQLNMDELVRKWDEADIYNKAGDYYTQMINIKTKLGAI
ncbi:unnamed protein product [Orchesella dallaii]|uniref:Uncharacterized protein n=1 Tax=Orchesella dallaii TaxID=48710 RepID=A0ABP1S4X6_9HEXA